MVNGDQENSGGSVISDGAARAWFCVRSQPKHEHIAAANLRRLEAMEVFCPRLRFKRSTRRGPVWFTEAMFPSYLFARFDWQVALRQVHHARGVLGVVHFGSRWPTVPDAVIAELKRGLGEDELRVLGDVLEAGDKVRIAGGAMHGLEGVVTRVMPARDRVAVLLDFLGRQASVEVALDQVIKPLDRGGLHRGSVMG